MGSGWSSPYRSVMIRRISSLPASSGRMNADTGSPGARASNMNTRIVMPKKIGIAIRSRRMM